MQVLQSPTQIPGQLQPLGRLCPFQQYCTCRVLGRRGGAQHFWAVAAQHQVTAEPRPMSGPTLEVVLCRRFVRVERGCRRWWRLGGIHTAGDVGFELKLILQGATGHVPRD
jgi:hypothetical protein